MAKLCFTSILFCVRAHTHAPPPRRLQQRARARTQTCTSCCVLSVICYVLQQAPVIPVADSDYRRIGAFGTYTQPEPMVLIVVVVVVVVIVVCEVAYS